MRILSRFGRIDFVTEIENIKNKYWIIGLSILLITGIVFGMYIYKWECRSKVFEIYFMNINRGRAIFIRTPNNHTILIDGGQNSEILRELSDLFPFYRRYVDMVIVTSEYPKNVGGLVDIVERYEIGKVIEPAIIGTSTAIIAFEDVVKKKHILVEKVVRGNYVVIDHVQFRILFPDPLFKFNKTSTSELVLEVSYGSSTVLLLGDASKTIQKSILGRMGKVNILEYSHAGSKSRVSAELVEVTQPDYIIKKGDRSHFISDGEKLWKKSD